MPLSFFRAHARFLILSLAISAYILSFFHRVAPAAIAQDLVASFHMGASSLGLLAAAYFYVYTVMQVPTGILVDTLGPRRILFLGGMVAGIGSLLFGLAPTFLLALVGRALVGLGVSVVFIAMLKLIAVWYEENRFATLTGVAMLLGNAGSVLAGTPLAWAAQTIGWRSIFVMAGGLSFVIALASLYWVRDRPQSEKVVKVGEGSIRWCPDLMRVLSNRATWPGFIVTFGIAGSFLSFAGLWAAPFLTQVQGLSRVVTSHHLSLYFLCFAIGSMVIGRLSDRMGQRKPLLIAGAIFYASCWLGLFAIIGHENTLVTYVLFAVMGLSTPCFTLTWSCAKEVNPPHLSGMATSVVNTGMFLSAALLQPLAGWLMDKSWDGRMVNAAPWYSAGDYRTGLLLHFGFVLLGTAATFWVRETRCRNIWVEKKSFSV